MRRTLNQIVALLVLPTAILATLWLSEALRGLHEHSHAKSGMMEISQHWSELNTLIHPAPEEAQNEREQGDQAQSTQAQLPKNLNGQIDKILQIINQVADESNLTAALTANEKILADFLTAVLPQATRKVRRVAMQAGTLGRKTDRNNWDRLSITISAGHMKSLVDQAAKARGLGAALDPEAFLRLAPDLDRLRENNRLFQKLTADIAIAIISDSTEPLGDEQLLAHRTAALSFMGAMDAYWQCMAGELIAVLDQREHTMRIVLIATALVCLILFTLAMLMALSLGKRLTRQTEQQLTQLALHDPLTSLPNRRAFKRELDRLVQDQRTTAAIGVVCMDLKNFKIVNDRFGEVEGDSILREVARRLEAATVDEHLFARIGGDQFALICNANVRETDFQRNIVEHTDQVAQDLNHAIAAMGWSDRPDLSIDMVAGTACHLGGPGDPDELLRNAQMALRAAKLPQSPGVTRYSTAMREEFDQDLLLAKRLRTALRTGQIEAWFQPQMQLSDKRIKGFEALARWRDPKAGIISPAVFLPGAQKAGLMPEIESEIRHQALTAMRQWLNEGLDISHVGINVSAELLSDNDFPQQLLDELARYELQPGHVGVEILESVMVDGPAGERVRNNVAKLAQAGCYLELDDFGTGYASLSSLRQLQVNQVKIDRSFIDGVDHKTELQKLTKALIELARSMNIDILAEGVETEAEQAWLVQNHCDVVQGYLLAKPMPAAEISPWVEQFHQQTVRAHENSHRELVAD